MRVNIGALRRLLDEPLDARFKSLPSADGLTVGTIADPKWNVVDGDLLLPVMVLQQSALEANIRTMAEFCRAHGVDLAPHGKTTMAPQLFARQLAAGAWAITAATMSQVRLLRAFGVDRVVLANEIVEPLAIHWVVAELSAVSEFDFVCYVDSVRGVARLGEVLRGCNATRPLRVLVELGQVGGRTGCRSTEEAASVAEAVNRTPGLELAGVAGFEGLIPATTPGEMIDAVHGFLAEMRGLTERLAQQGHLAHLPEVIVTAGGSAYFDLVVEHLTGWPAGLPVRTVLRSGCYVTHDAEMYEEVSPFGERQRPGEERRLRQALELWATVWSRPEPGLAIAGFGRRDAPYDYRLPVPLTLRTSAGDVRDVREIFRVRALNDQHAYVDVPAHSDVEAGDLLSFGINHPCTAFDKWQLIPVVDDDYTVIDAIRTFF